MAKAKPKEDWFKNDYYVMAYELARGGLKDADIAKGLPGCTGVKALKDRAEADPAFARSIAKGRRIKDDSNNELTTFREHIHGKLPPKAAALWTDLSNDSIEAEHVSKRQRALALVAEGGIRLRQRLFVHALYSTYTVGEACRLVEVSRETVDTWARNDDGFADLVAGLTEVKKDFFEGMFIQLAAQGNPEIVKHAVKTLCRDRGYGDKTEVNVNHQGRVDNVVTVQTFNLDDHLHELTPAARLELLRIMQRAKAAPETTIIDAAPALPPPAPENNQGLPALLEIAHGLEPVRVVDDCPTTDDR